MTKSKNNKFQFWLKIGEFPWTVAILKEERALDGQILNVYVCGGSIIDKGLRKQKKKQNHANSKDDLFTFQFIMPFYEQVLY